jgi:hypothetical protein
MRFPAVSLAFVAAILTVAPGASAQEPVRDFSQLNTRLKPGDTVWVTDAQGREIKGKITELCDASMTLDRDGTTTLQSDDVRLVQKGSKSVGKAALWGLVVGGVAGAVLGAVDSSGCSSDCISNGAEAVIVAGIGAGIGAGVGALVRAVLPAGRKDVYRAPGAPGSARLSIAPVVTPRAKGVAVSLVF